jgi:SAM-dependent methyltransferase
MTVQGILNSGKRELEALRQRSYAHDDRTRRARTMTDDERGRVTDDGQGRVTDQRQDLADVQRAHWQRTYTAHPGMYGEEPSAPAVHAAAVFRAAGARDVLELGAGHGRDALYFAREGFTVRATDFSATGLEQLRAAARRQGVVSRVTTSVHDVRDPLPLPDASVDAVFAHMLLCMALSTREIHALVDEVARVLRPGGTFVYTVRHTGDIHYGAGTSHGDDIFEHGGFAVHFFPRELVDALAEGWTLRAVDAFEEGELPRRLWRVTQTLPPEAVCVNGASA